MIEKNRCQNYGWKYRKKHSSNGTYVMSIVHMVIPMRSFEIVFIIFLPLTQEMKRMRLICASSIKLCLRLHLTASLREVPHLWGQVLALSVVWIWIEYILFLQIWSVDSVVESRAKMLMGPRPKVDLKNTHISYALRSVFDLWILHCGCHHNIWQSYDPNWTTAEPNGAKCRQEPTEHNWQRTK